VIDASQTLNDPQIFAALNAYHDSKGEGFKPGTRIHGAAAFRPSVQALPMVDRLDAIPHPRSVNGFRCASKPDATWNNQ
jgi:hypothetical protein